MSYNYYRRPRIIPQKINDPFIPLRLDAVINNPAVSAGDKQFCESLKLGWNKYNSLTAGQYGAFQKCETRYEPTVIAANAAYAQKRQDWIANFDEQKRAILKVCADYYSTTTYFKDLAVKVINDPTFIPSEKQYRAMCENKYAQRLLDNMKTTAKFAQGDVVVIRTPAKRAMWGTPKDVPHIVVEVSEQVSPYAGSRLYTLLPIGEDKRIQLPEKDIKKYRPNAEDELPRNKQEVIDDGISF